MVETSGKVNLKKWGAEGRSPEVFSLYLLKDTHAHTHSKQTER